MSALDIFEMDEPPVAASEWADERVLEYVYPLISDKQERNSVMYAYYAGESEASMLDALNWLSIHNLKLPADLASDVWKQYEGNSLWVELLNRYSALKR